MSQFAVIVPQRLANLAHEVVVENLDGIVDDILDERGTSTIILSSDLPQGELLTKMAKYLPAQKTLVFSVS